MICNFQLNPEDSIRVDHIYVPARPPLQGVMKHLINPAENVLRIPQPIEISLRHNNIELYFNFLY